jgi:NAD-dependent deacetylase
VFFGGAGVSTESGIPDFRSRGGLYNQEWKFPPEMILSRDFFERDTAEFYRFYRTKLLIDGIKPNKAHKALARFEDEGKLTAVITQNIDGLHQAAGSRNVIEVHGSVHRNNCRKCKKFFESIAGLAHVPLCDCGGLIKPDVVLYGEQLDEAVMQAAYRAVRDCETLIVGGTSLSVYPAAGLVTVFRGANLILINRTATQYDSWATLIFRDMIGEVLGDE